jgi:hypothetical protein
VEYVAQLKRLLEALEAHGVDYVMIGGAALNLHGLVRATEDVDFFIAPRPDNVERLKRALRTIWNDPSIDEISADDLCGDYPAVRYGPPSGSVYLDILTRLGERVRYEDLRSEVIDLDGVPARVATPRMLYEMKRDTVRPIDKADAEALRDAFDISEDDLDG